MLFRQNIDDQILEYGDLLSIWFGKTAWWLVLILLQVSQSVELIVSSWALALLLQKERVDGGSSSSSFGSNYHLNNGDDNTMEFDHQYDMHNSHHHHHQQRHELVEEMWTQRCRSFCKCAASSTCYLFGGRDLVDGVVGDYGQVRRALADYFEDGGVFDLVVSDIAAGFMMVQRRQRQRVLAARRRINDDLKGRKTNQQQQLQHHHHQQQTGYDQNQNPYHQDPHDSMRKKEPLTLIRENSSHSHSSGTNGPNGRKSISRASSASSMSWDTHN